MQFKFKSLLGKQKRKRYEDKKNGNFYNPPLSEVIDEKVDVDNHEM